MVSDTDAKNDATSSSSDAATTSSYQATAEERAEYEQRKAAKDRADRLGLDLPPVPPPGHRLVPVIETPKLTFWTLLFKRAESRSALYQLYITTLLMIAIPMGGMAIAYYILFRGLDDDRRLNWSGFVGVLGVNIVTIGFGLFAYWDKGGDDEADESGEGVASEAEEKRLRWEKWEKEQEQKESIEDQERLRTIREKHAEKTKGEKQQKEEGTHATSDDSSRNTCTKKD